MRRALLTFLSITLFISCSNDDDIIYDDKPSELLIGAWEDSSMIEKKESLQYNFKEDGTLSISTIVSDASTNQILGYRYHATGTYLTRQDQLTLMISSIYLHSDSNGPYSNLEDLELSDSRYEQTLTFSFNNSRTELLFTYPPCAYKLSCIGTQKFLKVD